MARAVATVRLDEARFLSLNYPSGPIGGFTNGLARRVYVTAKYRAPIRTGNLNRAIEISEPEVTAGKVSIKIRCKVPYATYVHNGTGLIFAGGKLMALYSARTAGRSRYADAAAAHPNRVLWINAKYGVVDGQDKQDFLASAASDVKRMVVH